MKQSWLSKQSNSLDAKFFRTCHGSRILRHEFMIYFYVFETIYATSIMKTSMTFMNSFIFHPLTDDIREKKNIIQKIVTIDDEIEQTDG